MYKDWVIKKGDDKSKPLIERLLAVRGITKKTEIKEFLNPLSMKLSEPTAFVDMASSVERISKAISSNQKIVIYGDFDADGITSTCVLMKTLKHLSANVEYYIPDRENEGHGMNTQTLIKIMKNLKPKVLITVDCGISNLEEVKFLKTFGVDVILTDHHEAPEELPPAFAIINPKAPNSLAETLSARKIIELTALAGCGVAFKLAQALLLYYEQPQFIYEILPLVAVGTIADIVPLIGENRYFVMKGLELIQKGQHLGLTKLLESSGYNPESGITSDNIAFGVAPRINATGRLDNVDTAIKVLLSDNKTEIELAVQTLNELNKVRQELCENTFLQAEEMYLQEISQNSEAHNGAIVLFNKDWNLGIIGIVASKFVEKYYKPTFIMGYHSETNQYRCSARSVKGVHLYDAIDAVSELLDGFGGHEMAAGLSFSEEKSTFEQVKNALNETVKEMSEGLDLKPFVEIDLELDEKDLDITLADEISKLEPFGASNPSPVFAIKDFAVKEKRLMGENKNHLRLMLQGQDALYTSVWWSHGDVSLTAGDRIDVAFSPKINNYKGNISLQLIIEDLHSDHLLEETPSQDTLKVFDHRAKNDIFQQVDDYVKTSKLNIAVFAENQEIVAKLKPYNSIYNRIITRKTAQNADCVMFFDYPADEKIYDSLLKTISPRHEHLMPFDSMKISEQSLFKTISGMVKFACNNKNGEFDLNKSAAYLSVDSECIEILLNILADCNMIKILNVNSEIYTLEFINNIEISNVLHCSKYFDLQKKLAQIQEYKENFKKQHALAGV